MTIKILKKTVNIELCHELFKTRVYYDTFEKQYVRLQSGKQEAASEDVAWTERDGFWMYMPELWDENYFGLCEQRPSAWETQSIACGFDFKNDGSGAFGRDEFGGILVLHTGDIPIGSEEAKALFWQHYKGPRVNGGEPSKAYAVVAHLGALDVSGQVREFLDEAVRIQQEIN